MTIKRLEGTVEDLLLKAANNIIELRPELAQQIGLQMTDDANNHGINIAVVHVWARLYRRDVEPEAGYLVRLARGESRPPDELSQEFADYYWHWDEIVEEDDEALDVAVRQWIESKLH